jgi:(S)-mandelate dehydrogenase
VLSVGDASRACAVGCDGIVLSNHGGRQLDYSVAAIDVLPEVVAAVGGRLSVIIDGGFRRGTDIVKALALGAEAVMLGRATLYGLGAGGEAGVARALEILLTETDRALGLLGCNAVSELGSQHVRRM